MPGPRKNRIHFRPLELPDAAYISRWLADSLGQSAEWERQFLRLLQDEWHKTGKLARQLSWMAMSGKHRLFFLEIAGEDEVFLTAPRGILENRITALAAWRQALVHLRGLGTLPSIRVTLDSVRDIECKCLLQLGFTELSTNGSPGHRTFYLAW